MHCLIVFPFFLKYLGSVIYFALWHSRSSHFHFLALRLNCHNLSQTMHTHTVILLSKPRPSRGSFPFTLFPQRPVRATCPTHLSSQTSSVSSKNHAARHRALPSRRPFIFPPLAPCSRTPFTWQTKFHTHTQQQPIERSAHAACVLLPCCLQWIPASVFC